jgi:predicted SAM-dependent methyltransferase
MIKVNLGCGQRNFGKEWIHIDGGSFAHLSKKYKSVELYEFPDDSIDVLYASHLIAYFDKVELSALLKQWRRKLKKGGVLRLATPDFEVMVELYNGLKVELQDIIGPLYGKMQMGDEWIYHKTTYDRKNLDQLLFDAGFNRSISYDWKHTDHSQFDDHSQAYLCPKGDKDNGVLISLNIETIK